MFVIRASLFLHALHLNELEEMVIIYSLDAPARDHSPCL